MRTYLLPLYALLLLALAGPALAIAGIAVGNAEYAPYPDVS